ncbi:enoyl-CoA hydratase [Pseudoalteromonas sp. NBT06-2]|uniref:enoyl-CoA hydratase-related protein n=1 Tax=Pseudoalteromonas sp. NBT06-2 TaxID=2025950 RepID=UPI000BA7D502|nr:enoyl-CoA hydratase-related protein [Pseudoalteromonas sp. NBT06-2]PAJ74713.1 enoyl-CoA hydratase [Pseudoalteromonas sp. NBT06-2]
MNNLPKLTDCKIVFQDKIALLSFNRDDVRNALTGTEIVNDIVKTVTWINKNQNVAVLIITGEGAASSSGGNIKNMAQRSGDFLGNVQELEKKYREGIQQMPIAMNKLEAPVIAAINGPAIGAGFDLANMCDIRIASTKAKFGETFANLGLIPGDGGAWFMQRIIGYQKAAELTFTGRVINAREAKEIGIVLDVTERQNLMIKAMELASDIANKPTASLRLTKRLMKMAQRTELGDFLDIYPSHFKM